MTAATGGPGFNENLGFQCKVVRSSHYVTCTCLIFKWRKHYAGNAKASKASPEYEVKTEKSHKAAIHKPGSLKKAVRESRG